MKWGEGERGRGREGPLREREGERERERCLFRRGKKKLEFLLVNILPLSAELVLERDGRLVQGPGDVAAVRRDGGEDGRVGGREGKVRGAAFMK